jgi:NTP pyrophosphatase (non-canonical NTP hydrolase)
MEGPVKVEDRPATGGDHGDDGDHGAAMTLAEAQHAVDAWISRFEEGYWPPLANLARLVEEVGELAREINHRHGSKPKKADEPETDLALELGDVLFVLIALANEQGIDLTTAFEKVLEKYEGRDSGRWQPRTT